MKNALKTKMTKSRGPVPGRGPAFEKHWSKRLYFYKKSGLSRDKHEVTCCCIKKTGWLY